VSYRPIKWRVKGVYVACRTRLPASASRMGLASTVRFSHRAPIMSIHRLRGVSLIAVAAATVACGDAPASTSPHASVASSGLLTGALYCTVTVGVPARAERSSPRAASIGCRTQAPGGVRVSTAGLATAQHDTVLSQQGVDVLVKFDSVFLTEGEDNASEMLTLWASVENLLSQDIGTSDGSTTPNTPSRANTNPARTNREMWIVAEITDASPNATPRCRPKSSAR